MTLEPVSQPIIYNRSPRGWGKGRYMKKILILLLCLVFMAQSAYAHNHGHGQERPTADLTILLAFGTSDPEAEKSLQAIEDAYKKRAENYGGHTMMVFSSNIIRKKLREQGKTVYSIDEALDMAAKKGYKNLEIQSLHVAPAEEYMKVNRLIARSMERNPNRFESVFFGHPLLMSEKDLELSVDAVINDLPKERQKNEAVIFMGHGNNRGTGDILLKSVNTQMQSVDPLIWLANVEGALPFDRILPLLAEKNVKKVWLAPFMIVAGDHAKNDMAGSEADSWKSILTQNGYQVETLVKGMGHNKTIQNIFIDHTDHAYDDIMNGTILSSHSHH